MKFIKRLFPKTDDVDSDLVQAILENMVMIPAGSFLMGSLDGEDDERPIHNVLINGFMISRHVVTQHQFMSLIGKTPWDTLQYYRAGDNFPAVNVNWYDVKDFLKKLKRLTGKNFRLPTEAEWEYACRAGTTTCFNHGAFKFNLGKYAWYYDNAFKKGEMYAHEVAKKKANHWGLFDMTGNVYEWCLDWFSRNYYNKSPVNNPKGPRYGTAKVVRGGDWSRTDYFLRSSSRRYYSPHYKDSYLGFRVVLDVKSVSNTE